MLRVGENPARFSNLTCSGFVGNYLLTSWAAMATIETPPREASRKKENTRNGNTKFGNDARPRKQQYIRFWN
jgi:hypothetical protein